MLDTVANENQLYVPDFETKGRLHTNLGRDENGRSTVHITGAFPNRKAYDNLNQNLEFFGHQLGQWVPSSKKGVNRHEGVKLDKKGVFHFDNPEDANIFANAVAKYIAMPNEEKQQRATVAIENVESNSKFDLENLVANISDKESQDKAQRILDHLNNGILSPNEARFAIEKLTTPPKKTMSTKIESSQPKDATQNSEKNMDFEAAVNAFYSDDIINMEQLDRNLDDENSFIRLFLNTHDVIADK